MRTLLLLVLFSVSTRLNSHGQTQLSLNQALELGLKNRFDLQADAIQEALTENSIRKTRNNWLPELTASGNVRYNTQLQTTVIPAGSFPGLSETQRVTFGTRNSTVFALDLTQPLLRPEAKTDLALARNSGALEAEKNNQRKTNIKIKIAEAYLNVLLKDLQRSIARTDELRYKAYFQVAEGQLKLGTLNETDYLTARLNYQNSEITSQKTEDAYRAAQYTLCYQLNITPDTALVLTDRIDPNALAAPSAVDLSPLNERSEIRQLKLERESFVLQRRKVLDALKPTLSLYGNYSVQFLANRFNYFSDMWFPFNYVGLQVRMPLSGQFAKRDNVYTYQLKARQTELKLLQTEADQVNESRQTASDLSNAARTLQSTKGSLDVAHQLVTINQEQFRLGTLLYNKLLDAESSLQTAQQNYLEAAYNYLVAQLNFQKARGFY